MRIKRSDTLTQRRVVGRRIQELASRGFSSPPPTGWIKAIRGALGMTSQQLADRMSTDQSAVVRMEAREVEGKITLETLERAAHAMNCKVMYALLPFDQYHGSLDEIVNERATELARKMMERTSHHMALEDQRVNSSESEDQLLRLVRELAEKGDSSLWSRFKR